MSSYTYQTATSGSNLREEMVRHLTEDQGHMSRIVNDLVKSFDITNAEVRQSPINFVNESPGADGSYKMHVSYDSEVTMTLSRKSLLELYAALELAATFGKNKIRFEQPTVNIGQIINEGYTKFGALAIWQIEKEENRVLEEKYPGLKDLREQYETFKKMVSEKETK